MSEQSDLVKFAPRILKFSRKIRRLLVRPSHFEQFAEHFPAVAHGRILARVIHQAARSALQQRKRIEIIPAMPA
jgi:hypothetical protein